MAKTTEIFLVNCYASPADLPATGWADAEVAIVQSNHSFYTWDEGGNVWLLLGTGGGGAVNTVNAGTDISITGPATDPVVNWTGAHVDKSVTGTGLVGNPLTLVNDVTSPGNLYYYGTNASGVKGFYTISSTGGITGSGVANRFAIWDSTTNITNTANAIFDLSTFEFEVSDGGNQFIHLDPTTGFIELSVDTNILLRGTGTSSTYIQIALNGAENITLNTGNSGSPLANTQLQLDWPTASILGYTAGALVFSLVAGVHLYQMGDISIANNGGLVFVDDDNKTTGLIAYQTGTQQFLVLDGNTNSIQMASQSAGFQVNGYNNSIFFAPDGTVRQQAFDSHFDLLETPGGASTQELRFYELVTNGTDYFAFRANEKTDDIQICRFPAGGPPSAGYGLVVSSVSLPDIFFDWAAVGSGITGSGSANWVTYWTSGSNITGTQNFQFNGTGTLTLGFAGSGNGELDLRGNGSGVISIGVNATAGTWSLVLPTTGPTADKLFCQNSANSGAEWRSLVAGDLTYAYGTGTITPTIANDAVTFAKFQNITGTRLLGRYDGTSGDMEEIVLGTNLSFTLNTLNVTGFASSTLTKDHIFVGNASNVATDVAMSGDATIVAAGTITIANNAVTYAKMQAVSTTSKLLGSSSTTTPVQEITLGSGLSLSGTTLTATGTGGSGFADNVFYIYDDGDNTKKLAWQVSGITTGTTRTITALDISGTDVLSNGALTATRVPYWTASGLADNANFVWDNANSQLSLLGAGTAAIPTIGIGGTDIGFYLATANTLGVATSGNARYTISGGSIQSVTNGGLSITRAAGSASAPTYSFRGNTNAGMYSDAANTIKWTTNSAQAMTLDSSARLFVGGSTAPTAFVTIAAGTTSIAPLQFTSGTSLSSAVAGSIEFTTDDLFFTISTGTARKRLLMADPVGGLTSGRVPFATTNGRLTDDADLTFATDTLTCTIYAVGTRIEPTSNDGAPLGSTTKQFSDLFLAEGGVINWDNGDATITQTADDITIAGISTFGVGTSTAVTLGTIELGAASDTTIARVSAGVASIEGVTIATASNTLTLTNKTIGVTQLNGSAYTMAVNNTNATANYTEVTHKYPGKQTYSGSISWTAGTAPSGSTNHSYIWSQFNKTVNLVITLVYAVAGSTCTIVSMALPSDCPAPLEFDGLGAASTKMYSGSSWMDTALTGNPPATRGWMRVNSGDTGWDLVVIASSQSALTAQIEIEYFAA